jgi:hypothetical protein
LMYYFLGDLDAVWGTLVKEIENERQRQD